MVKRNVGVAISVGLGDSGADITNPEECKASTDLTQQDHSTNIRLLQYTYSHRIRRCVCVWERH